jgi:hypothetical protein
MNNPTPEEYRAIQKARILREMHELADQLRKDGKIKEKKK